MTSAPPGDRDDDDFDDKGLDADDILAPEDVQPVDEDAAAHADEAADADASDDDRQFAQ